MNIPEKIHYHLGIKNSFNKFLILAMTIVFIITSTDLFIFGLNIYYIDLVFLLLTALIIVYVSIIAILCQLSKWAGNDPNHRAMPFITQFGLIFIVFFIFITFSIDFFFSEENHSHGIYRNIFLITSSIIMLGNYRLMMLVPLKERITEHAGIAAQQGMKYQPYEKEMEKEK